LELLALLVIYFLATFLWTGVFAVTASSRKVERLVRSWSAYARRQRYQFEEATSPERPFRIVGRRDGVDFVLEVQLRSAVVTRLLARAPSPAPARVVATLGRARSGEPGERVPTGDAHFDSLFDVRASDADAVARMLGPAVRMALQRFPLRMVGGSLRLVQDGEDVIVEWAEGDVDPGALDAAHAILREVCRASARES
jgi:hypothetical protein